MSRRGVGEGAEGSETKVCCGLSRTPRLDRKSGRLSVNTVVKIYVHGCKAVGDRGVVGFRGGNTLINGLVVVIVVVD
jgi:hypothetical protein